MPYGQITQTGSAQQIDSAGKAGSCVTFIIKAPLSNASGVYIGDDASVTNSTGHQLDPGDEMTYERLAQNGQPYYQATPSKFWVWIVTPGDKVTWLGLV